MCTYDSLKRYLTNYHRPDGKPFFDIHDPVGRRYLFQLRLGLSPLRGHKSYGFIDTPSDSCLCKQGAEDRRHFLLSRPFYGTKRTALMSIVNEILLKNYLNYPANFPVNELNSKKDWGKSCTNTYFLRFLNT